MTVPPTAARLARALLLAVSGLAAGACGGVRLGTRSPASDTPTPSTRAEPEQARIDPVAYYHQRGLLAHGAPMPFVGSVGFAATATADSTFVIVALALSPDALTFRREGDGFRSDYRISMQIRRDAEVLAGVEAVEAVRVATLRETSRGDEGVLFQQVLSAPPGSHVLNVEVRDVASGRSASQAMSLNVPRFGSSASLGTPLVVLDWIPRTSRAQVPRVVTNPRGLATAGRDSALSVYVEAYDAPGATIGMALRVEGQAVWSSSVSTSGASALGAMDVRLPAHPIALGSADLVMWLEGQGDTVRAPVFVGFDDDIPATSYADLLSYLEYFISARRLQQLRQAAPRDRGAAWQELMRATDPVVSTAENEALRSYFARMRQANASYAEGSLPGWRTDRGMVLLLLGEPDQVLDQFSGDPTLRGRLQQWEYRSLNLSIVFEDAMGLNRWRLTRASEAALATERDRRQSGP